MGIKFESVELLKMPTLGVGATFRLDGRFFIMTFEGPINLETGDLEDVSIDVSVERVDLLMRLA